MGRKVRVRSACQQLHRRMGGAVNANECMILSKIVEYVQYLQVLGEQAMKNHELVAQPGMYCGHVPAHLVPGVEWPGSGFS